jgi:Spy/CpxP family protein refolding chaperone
VLSPACDLSLLKGDEKGEARIIPMSPEVISMRMTRHRWIVPALAAVLGAGSWATAQEGRDFRPEVAQLVQSVSERLDAAADQLGLIADQRAKMRETRANFAEKYQALRGERRELLRSELEALSAMLTPEQREKVRDFVEDRVEARTAAPTDRDWPRFAETRDTIAARMNGAAASLALTADQRSKIRDAHARFTERYQAERAKRRQLVEDEFNAIAASLTPEQRQKAREAIEERAVRAPFLATVAGRLDAAADSLGLDTAQREKIIAARRPFAEKYRALRAGRHDLLQDELQAIGAVLTPEQRQKVRDFCDDRVVIVGSAAEEGRDRAEALKHLRETVAERIETVADKLGLTTDQRSKIRDAHAAFAQKFRGQREERKALRQQELEALSAILTPEQREKVRDFVEDQVGTTRGN